MLLCEAGGMKSPLRGSGRPKENVQFWRDRADAYKAVAVDVLLDFEGSDYDAETADQEIEERADRKFVEGISR
jgi:hypothetical protein